MEMIITIIGAIVFGMLSCYFTMQSLSNIEELEEELNGKAKAKKM